MSRPTLVPAGHGVQLEEPSFGATVPGGQSWQKSSVPRVSVNVPGGHLTQTLSKFPSNLEVVPGLHVTQRCLRLPAPPKPQLHEPNWFKRNPLFSLQRMHVVPSCPRLLGGQGTQVLFGPGTSSSRQLEQKENTRTLPGTQLASVATQHVTVVHLLTDLRTSPLAQTRRRSTHFVRSSSLLTRLVNPRGHLMQLVCPELGWNVSTGHLLHSNIPGSSVKVPASHSEHSPTTSGSSTLSKFPIA
eukprot:GFKZ01005528.1.p2 GENE.GFKZ01005528.1~~GFKZ01005528.1.p2  ORF type:complete len:274 (-),score=0.77 GFKZ01005528.1:571-1299(-)